MDASDIRMTDILIVEDDDVDATSIRRAFEAARITNPLHFARDGVEALELLRGGSIPRGRRLVLLDLHMPRMGGLEMLAELRKDPALRGTSVIVMTSSNDDRDRVEAWNLGVAGYVRKPVSFSGLVDIVAQIDRYWALVEQP